MTGKEYEVLARVLLGFQAVVIFGVKAITPSIKQVVVYVPYYIDKAREDGKTIGLPLTLGNISDATMETAQRSLKLNFTWIVGVKRCQSNTAQLIVHQSTELKLALTNSWE